jgi:hypothetical protein
MSVPGLTFGEECSRGRSWFRAAGPRGFLPNPNREEFISQRGREIKADRV